MTREAAQWDNITRHPQNNDHLGESIKNISLSIPHGFSFGFIGDKNSGSITLVHLLLDFIKPDAGRVKIFGAPPGPAVKDKIGYCPEFFNSFPGATSGRLLKLFAELKTSGGQYNFQYPEELEIDPLLEVKFKNLNPDQKKRLGLAAAAINNPDLLVLVEPTTCLNPDTQENLFRVLNRRQKNENKTTLVVSSQINLVRRLCEKNIRFENGRIKKREGT